MVRTILLTAVATLLGFAVVCQGLPAACNNGLGTLSSSAKMPCKCCAKALPAAAPASTPACCTATPTGQRAPATPASTPVRGLNERLLAPALFVLPAIEPRADVSENFVLSFRTAVCPSAAVPIFQRDCSYLI